MFIILSLCPLPDEEYSDIHDCEDEGGYLLEASMREAERFNKESLAFAEDLGRRSVTPFDMGGFVQNDFGSNFF